MKRLSVLAVILLAACSPKPQKTGVEVSNAWIKAAPVAMKTSAGFMVLQNHNARPEKILSAEFSASNVVELHEMLYENDMMKMRKMDAMVIPAKGSLVLEPGGLHVMFIDLKQDLKEGETYDITLNLESGQKLVVPAPVKPYSHGGMH